MPHPLHGCCIIQQPAIIIASCCSDRQYVAFAYDKKYIRIFDALTNKQVGSDLVGHQELITSIQFSSDNRMLVSGSFDSIRVWDVDTGQQIKKELIHNDQLCFKVVCFSPNGQFIACGGYRISNIVWNINNSSQPFKCLKKRQIGSMQYSPDNRLLISNEGHIWNTLSYYFQRIIHKTKFNLVKVSPNSKQFALGGNGILKISDIKTRKQINRLNGIKMNVEVISYSKRGDFLISTTESRQIVLWNLTNRTNEILQNDTLSAYSVYFSTDDNKFIVISSEYQIIYHLGTFNSIPTSIRLMH